MWRRGERTALVNGDVDEFDGGTVGCLNSDSPSVKSVFASQPVGAFYDLARKMAESVRLYSGNYQRFKPPDQRNLQDCAEG
jgi:hypothetical protein